MKRKYEIDTLQIPQKDVRNYEDNCEIRYPDRAKSS